MQTLAPQKSNLRLATENYAAYISLCFVMGALSFLQGDALSLVALKVIFAPFFLLAKRAIPTFFNEPIVEARFTARSIECHLLLAAAFAGFMTVFAWSPEKSVAQIALTLCIAFIIMGMTQMLILWLRIRDLRKQVG